MKNGNPPSRKPAATPDATPADSDTPDNGSTDQEQFPILSLVDDGFPPIPAPFGHRFRLDADRIPTFHNTAS